MPKVGTTSAVCELPPFISYFMLNSLNPRDWITVLAVCLTMILLIDRSEVETVPAICQVFQASQPYLILDCIACVNLQPGNYIQHKKVKRVDIMLENKAGVVSDNVVNAYFMESKQCHMECRGLLEPDDFTFNDYQNRRKLNQTHKITEVIEKNTTFSHASFDVTTQSSSRVLIARYRVQTKLQATQIRVIFTQQNYYIRLIFIIFMVISRNIDPWLMILTMIPHISWLTTPLYVYCSNVFGRQSLLVSIMYLVVLFTNMAISSNMLPIASKLTTIILISIVNFNYSDVRVLILTACYCLLWFFKLDNVGLAMFWLGVYCLKSQQEEVQRIQVSNQDTDINV